MTEKEEKLYNIKHKNAHVKIFNLFYLYEMCKINTSICYQLLFDIFHLIWIDKVQSCRVDLKSTTYDFLDKLS